jgi:hypothetical protein
MVNIWPGQSVGMALASYHDRLFWGFHAVGGTTHLEVLAKGAVEAFEELAAAARPGEARRIAAHA